MTQRIEVKAQLTVSDAGLVEGVAWPFGSGDRVGDWVEKGAFSGVVGPLPMLAFHNPNDVVGVWESATEDGVGFRVKGRLLVDDLPRARELRAMLRSGAVQGLSIGFITKKSAPRAGGGRTISALDLVEVSLVSVPAHPRARVTVAKSGAEAIRLAAAISRAAARLRA